MATLEKIRQRKKILAIVIGAALIAFIIETGIQVLGRQAVSTTAAKVGSEKIEIDEYQRRMNKETARDQNNNQMDAAVRQQRVLDNMINEKLLEQEYDKVGIFVSDNEISQLMIGEKAAPAVVQFAQQMGAESPAQLYDFITNPGKQGIQESQVAELRAQWDDLTQNMVNGLKLAKLQQLVAGSLQANDLDRKYLAEDAATTATVTFVKKDVASIPDDQVEVSDAELKAEWARLKPMFAIDEPLRSIHYIAVDIAPSPEDVAAADTIVARAYEALQQGHGVEAVRLLGTVKIDSTKQAINEVPAAIKDFVAAANVGDTKRMDPANNHYVMYKLLNRQVSLDSVNYDAVAVSGPKSLQDSVLALLNSGRTIEEVAKAVKDVQGQADNWTRVAGLADSIKAKFANAGTDFFAIVSNDQGAQLIKVNERKAPKTFYTVATVSYDAYASSKTSDDLRNKLQAFLNKNKTLADFEKNAAEAGYNAIETMISSSTPQLGVNQFTGQGIKDSRKAIKWAFDNKKGSISPIFSDNNNMLLVVAVDNVFDGDYVPYTLPQVKDMLTTRVRNAKKADKLMADYKGKGKDLASYATAMGVSVDTTTVVFSQDRAPKIEAEPGLIGRMAVAKQGAFNDLWKGQNGVYAFVVTNTEKEQREVNKDELNQRFDQSRGGGHYANERMIYTVLGKATKVKKNLINFF